MTSNVISVFFKFHLHGSDRQKATSALMIFLQKLEKSRKQSSSQQYGMPAVG